MIEDFPFMLSQSKHSESFSATYQTFTQLSVEGHKRPRPVVGGQGDVPLPGDVFGQKDVARFKRLHRAVPNPDIDRAR